MTHYYSRESKTVYKNFTVMEVIPGTPERLVCRTPRGDVAAHLVTQLNLKPIPVKADPPPNPFKVGDKVQHKDKSTYLILPTGCWSFDVRGLFPESVDYFNRHNTLYTKVPD